MSKAVDSVAKTYINAASNGNGNGTKAKVAEGLLNRVEASRSRPPFSTHAIGQMSHRELLDPCEDRANAAG
jgi:hypothetical protein